MCRRIFRIFPYRIGLEGAASATPHLPDRLLESYQLALESFLNEHCSDLLAPVKVHKKVEIGAPDRSIVEKARKEGSDLIVISTHGRTGLSRMLLGSVTEKVVRSAPCPVLSIRSRPEA